MEVFKRKYELVMLEQAGEFYKSLPAPVQDKITLYFDRVLLGQVNKKIFKKLNKYIWELRVKYNGTAYRMFSFFDKYNGNLVVATNGIIKKSQKTPPNALDNAMRIMKQYYLENYLEKL